MTREELIKEVLRHAMYWKLSSRDLDQLIELIRKVDKI